MEKTFVRDLVADQQIDSPFLISELEIKQKRNGEDFLTLVLSDRTGEIRAVLWDGVAEAAHEVSKGDFALVSGKVSLYQDQPQVTVQRLRRLERQDVDESMFLPSTAGDIEAMWRELADAVGSLRQPKLRSLLEELLADEEVADRFRRSPAAKSHHHVFRGGLLEHTVSLIRLCEAVAGHYKMLNRDLLVAGAVLHDFGKLRELRYEREFDYTDEGRLVGHIVMAAAELDRRMRDLEFDDQLRTQVLHIVVSHHGEELYGSPKKPMTAEALALHFLDMLDSRMEMVRAALEREEGRDGAFTSWVRSLERFIYKGE